VAATAFTFAFALAFALALTVALALVVPRLALAQPPADLPELAPYRDATNILGATPASDDGAVGALFNPAQWGVLEKPEFAFWWSDRNVRPNGLDSWGASFGQGVGFSVRRTDARIGPDEALRSVSDFQLGFGGGDGGHFGGAALGWSAGDEQAFDHKTFISLGSIHRPARHLSIGASGRAALGDDDLEGVLDVGVRPLGTPALLLFADYAITRDNRLDEGSLAFGAALRPIPGFYAAAKYDDDENVQLALGIFLNREGVEALPRYDDDGDLDETNYVVRMNPPVRGFDLDAVHAKRERYASVELKGRVGYQRPRFGDDKTLALRGITNAIQFAIDDPTVGGVVINLSGFNANIETTWEIREKLARLSDTGKRIVVYGDQFKMENYYLASVADQIVVDPQGGLLMPGVQLSRTYYKETLAKMGVAFEEWRFFEYKSALEAFSRSNMSDADRVQRQELVDGTYNEMIDAIAASGRATRVELDRIVNEEPVLDAEALVERGLADRIGHWEDIDAITDTLAGEDANVRVQKLSALRMRRWQPNEEWGKPPVIALVYAVGPCAMDEGINGRATSKAMKKFRERKSVKAVVLRADSPGGDPLPSDLVAHEMVKLREKHKPILVSQGRVAASGGYWISMNADTIATSPFCVTGSIGVIGGWFWNDRLSEKIGMTSDQVQAGRSADLFGGLRIPLLGVTVPERNLDDAEKALMRERIFGLYDDFTEKVAASRKLDVSYVREIGEGRVYLGRAALDKKLVDRVATLDETIESAKLAAGIKKGRRVQVVEYPEPKLFEWPRTFPGPVGSVARALSGALGFDNLAGEALVEAAASANATSSERTYDESAFESILRAPGRPLTLTPAGLLPNEAVPQ
jgi:protease-4